MNMKPDPCKHGMSCHCFQPSYAFQEGVQKNTDDMLIEQRKLFAANSKMSIELESLRSELSEIRAKLVQKFNEGYDVGIKQAEAIVAQDAEMMRLKDNLVGAAKDWRIHHVCCPKDCPDLHGAQKRLGDSIAALAAFQSKKGKEKPHAE